MSQTGASSVGPLGPLAISVNHTNDGPVAEELLSNREDGDLLSSDVTIMLVDDEPINIELLELHLAEAGCESLIAATNADQAINVIRSRRPDVILLDTMSDGSGFHVLESVHADPRLRHIPVIMLTGVDSADLKVRALKLGVIDFLSKPVESIELIMRLHNTLAAKTLRDRLARYSKGLERQVRRRTAELLAARQEAMHCLARAAEYRDDDTGQHVIRVGRYVGIIARRLGFDPRRVEALELAAQLHDVGKIGIPDSILLKPGKLESSEFELMKGHCSHGRTIIEPLTDDDWSALRRHAELGARIIGEPSSPIMKLAARIAETHHEKWDGSGYPRGLRGEQIPIEGRITAVADVYDALSSERPYKRAFPRKKCFSILEEGRGKHFDPQLLDAFFSCVHDIIAVQSEYADG